MTAREKALEIMAYASEYHNQMDSKKYAHKMVNEVLAALSQTEHTMSSKWQITFWKNVKLEIDKL